MKPLSLTDAADLAQVGKTTLRRMIHKGRLSAHRDEQGAFWIDPSELARVFPEIGAPGGADRREVELLREMVERERQTNADLRQRLDKADEERRRLLALLNTWVRHPVRQPRHLVRQVVGMAAEAPCGKSFSAGRRPGTKKGRPVSRPALFGGSRGRLGGSFAAGLPAHTG